SIGMIHGNIHPGTVLIDTDGRVVLSDANADGSGSPEDDVRAVGAVLYFALTGFWPHAEAVGPASLPDAPRDTAGAFPPPGRLGPGGPAHLHDLAAGVLARRVPPPQAEVLVGGPARLDSRHEAGLYAGAEPAYEGPAPGPLRLTREHPDTPRPRS